MYEEIGGCTVSLMPAPLDCKSNGVILSAAKKACPERSRTGISMLNDTNEINDQNAPDDIDCANILSIINHA